MLGFLNQRLFQYNFSLKPLQIIISLSNVFIIQFSVKKVYKQNHAQQILYSRNLNSGFRKTGWPTRPSKIA